ncbi:hypothetical protein RhiirA5_433675, partial [Rhizophagus irregularis]
MLINSYNCDCDYECNAKRFKRNFKNWTSGNNNIDKFIQDTQLLEHNYYEVHNALEWIPYDKLYDIKYITEDNKFGKVYRANWIDGCIDIWDHENKNWGREDQNMFVILKILNNPSSITLEFINKIAVPHEIAVPHKVFGITQDPETKNYMMVSNINKCGICYATCNSMCFQRNFENWTSGNNDIDKFIQDIQLLDHDNANEALEWISYDRLYNVKYIAEDNKFGKVYRANWIDGYIY